MASDESMNIVKGQFCPACKYRNDIEATVCVYCGSELGSTYKVNLKTQILDEESIAVPDAVHRVKTDELLPEHGIALYLLNNLKPITVQTDKEFVLGRKLEDSTDTVVDLSPYDGYVSGVSRRHALIRQTKKGVELIDLGSVNGTWLNDQRLKANVPYPLESGELIGLGKMRLQVFWRNITR
jgi:hypothetical protein